MISATMPHSSSTDISKSKEHGEIRDVEKTADVEEMSNNDNDNESPRSEDIPPLRGLSILDRFLVVWILLAMAIGMVLGAKVPSAGPTLQRGTFVGVSIPIAIGLLLMMYPILCKIRFESLITRLFRRQTTPSKSSSPSLLKHLLLSILLNWLLAPALMTALAWAFLPDRPDLRTGLIYVGIARCIAMVLVWTDLAGGDGEFCAVLVALNSVLQMVLFAPLAVFWVGVVGGEEVEGGVGEGYRRVAVSVAVFLGIPLGAAVVTRLILRALIGDHAYKAHFLRYISPISLLGLLYTIIVLFASQGAHVVDQITSVLRVCAPLLVYFLVVFSATIFLCWKLGFGYGVSCAQGFTAASNNFELAIAVVVAVYGAGSGQALASTVGPLIEVPVLVALVYVLKWVRRRWGWKG
ncbi:arsenical-resistance protein ACR3 [Aulographum hederae CBS 113979]|uniref:Arsenical-resistance protein ACR3 n=1 Tax=Aulographum hederae CBS 113979 TaxID=1176131 RepID=A0A6G1GXM4_9PEZI|nr:arsenical-resistance protein ACR3 [Aulographum hederae CBS 113979]